MGDGFIAGVVHVIADEEEEVDVEVSDVLDQTIEDGAVASDVEVGDLE